VEVEVEGSKVTTLRHPYRLNRANDASDFSGSKRVCGLVAAHAGLRAYEPTGYLDVREVFAGAQYLRKSPHDASCVPVVELPARKS
jgi:hypothetical protein